MWTIRDRGRSRLKNLRLLQHSDTVKRVMVRPYRPVGTYPPPVNGDFRVTRTRSDSRLFCEERKKRGTEL